MSADNVNQNPGPGQCVVRSYRPTVLEPRRGAWVDCERLWKRICPNCKRPLCGIHSKRVTHTGATRGYFRSCVLCGTVADEGTWS